MLVLILGWFALCSHIRFNFRFNFRFTAGTRPFWAIAQSLQLAAVDSMSHPGGYT